MSGGGIAGVAIAGVAFIFLLIVFILVPKNAYFSAIFSGTYISAFRLISMKMRKENYTEISQAYILDKKAKLNISIGELELISASGGNPKRIVEGLIAAKNAKLNLDIEFAKAVDISGADFLEVVSECTTPKVVELPLITAVAHDKQEVNVKVSISLKTKPEKYLDGLNADTVLARTTEAVITKITNTAKGSHLVSMPQLLDKAIYDAGVDEDSRYELVSADIVSIDYGVNKALLDEREQLEKNRIIAANQLEHRRLTAVAVEQEMRARAEEMRAKTIANEAEVPKAIIKAIEEGKIKDVIDYYKLENLQADTEMRRKLLDKKDTSNKR